VANNFFENNSRLAKDNLFDYLTYSQ